MAIKMLKLVTLTALVVATPVLALEMNRVTALGTTEDEVWITLTDMGYEVRRTEMENGAIEAYYIKGDEKGEVYVDAGTGQIIKIEQR